MANKTRLEIRTAVKDEARVKTGTQLDTMIDRIINDVYTELCENAEYDELFVPEATLTITSDEQTTFTLPADFRQLAYVEFSTTGDAWSRLVKRNVYSLPLTQGYPRWFFTSSLGLTIFPYTSILTTHFVRIAYWKRPPELSADNSPILVQALYNPIVKRVLDRIFRYHQDEKSARVFRQDAMESESRSVK
jgi:hypothetical protein